MCRGSPGVAAMCAKERVLPQPKGPFSSSGSLSVNARPNTAHALLTDRYRGMGRGFAFFTGCRISGAPVRAFREKVCRHVRESSLTEVRPGERLSGA